MSTLRGHKSYVHWVRCNCPRRTPGLLDSKAVTAQYLRCHQRGEEMTGNSWEKMIREDYDDDFDDEFDDDDYEDDRDDSDLD